MCVVAIRAATAGRRPAHAPGRRAGDLSRRIIASDQTMKPAAIAASPKRKSYDVVIIGGAVIGSASAWFLSANPDFDGTVLVVERDPTYQWTSTATTNSCIRKQFSNAINVRISQFASNSLTVFGSNSEGMRPFRTLPWTAMGTCFLAGNTHFCGGVAGKPGALQQACGVKHPHHDTGRDCRGLSLLLSGRYRARQPQHRQRGLF